MIFLYVIVGAVSGGVVGAAITIRNMPHLVARMTRDQRLKFAQIVNALADDE